MKRLRKYFVLSVLFSLVLFRGFAQSYYITEEQLTELQTIISTQKEQLETMKNSLITSNQAIVTLKNNLNILNSQLEEQKQYYKQLEKNSKLKIIKGIGITIGISIPVGLLAGILIGVNVK